MKQMHLEDAFEDNPGTRNLLKLMEEDAAFVRDYTSSLQSHLGNVLNAQSDLCNALGSLSQHLKSYQDYGNYNNSDTVLPEVLKRFAIKVDDLGSMQQILISQIADGLSPLKKFVLNDIAELFVLKEVFMATKNELNRVLGTHLKFSKKKEKEKQAKDLEDEMFIGRKKFHEATLKYYTSLNSMQLKKVLCTVESLSGLIKAHVIQSELNNDFAQKLREEDFQGSMEAINQSISEEVATDKAQSVEEVERLEMQSVEKYFVEPPVEHVRPFADLKQKAGYLMLRSKSGLLASRWDKHYFFIQGGSLMHQGIDEMVGQSIADLGFETRVDSADIDDRRFVFTIQQPVIKKHITLQAESCYSRDAWIATILNASKESAYQVPLACSTSEGSTHQRILSNDGTLHFDAPIQFDIITPCHEPKTFSEASFERRNPFDESGRMRLADGSKADSIGEFPVGFIGSQQVSSDRGDDLLRETMRQILAARALHNIFKMPHYNLAVSQCSLVLMDPQVNIIKSEVPLENISFWGVHEDNRRLFGFISRTKNVDDAPTFVCHVFECSAGDQICDALSSATQMAYKAFIAGKEANVGEETELFLKNLDSSTLRP